MSLLSCVVAVLCRCCLVLLLSRVVVALCRCCLVSLLSCVIAVLCRCCLVSLLSCVVAVSCRCCLVSLLFCVIVVLCRCCLVSLLSLQWFCLYTHIVCVVVVDVLKDMFGCVVSVVDELSPLLMCCHFIAVVVTA